MVFLNKGKQGIAVAIPCTPFRFFFFFRGFYPPFLLFSFTDRVEIVSPIFTGLCVLVADIHKAHDGHCGKKVGKESCVCHLERILCASCFLERLDLVPAMAISSRCVWALHRASTVRGAVCLVAVTRA